jgi:cysteine dioxygenase
MPQPPLTTLAELDGYTDRIPLDVLKAWLSRNEVTLGMVRSYTKFSAEHYVRNLLHSGPAYQALVICWHSGQRSPIHDHRGSSCAVKVISGVATETIFARAANGMYFATSSHQLAAGDSCASQDADVHQMSNLQAEGTDLVTLHIYSPPLFRMNMFSLVDPKVVQFFDPVNEEFASGAGI